VTASKTLPAVASRGVVQADGTQEIQQLVAATEGRQGSRTLCLIDTSPGVELLLRRSALQLVTARGGRLIELPCGDCGPDSLGVLRLLARQIVPIVKAEAPDEIVKAAAEIAELDPELAKRLGIHPPQSLGKLANVPSERRSHRESEVFFRTVNAVTSLLFTALGTGSSLAQGPVLLWWSDLHAADRSSLLAFRRISRWANQEPGRLALIATVDLGGSPRAPDPPAPDAAAAQAFDWRTAHQRVLADVLAQSLGRQVRLTTSDVGPDSRPAAGSSLPGPLPVAEAVGCLVAGQLEEGAARALRAMAGAAFMLNYEAILLLAGHLAGHLSQPGADYDHAAFTRAWEQTEPGARYAAIEFAVTLPTDRDDLLASSWKAAGFANTCLDRHETALACYQRALTLARTPARRAQALMYLALINGKRLHRGAEAAEYLRSGLAEVAGETDPDSVLEHGWLLNVSALMAFQQRHHGEAMKMVTQARRIMRPLHTSEATHLKVNLVSNASVLLEQSGRTEKAIEMWRSFTAFLEAANELFARHYYFREAGLLVKAGRIADALTPFRLAYEQAVAVHDPFHAAITASACGYVCYHLDDLTGAADWYATALALTHAAGDHERMPHAQAALALVRARTGARAEAETLLADAAIAAARLSVPGTGVLAVQQWLDGDGQPALAPAEAAVLEPPGTKLNRPFSLINTYRAEQAG